MSQEHRIRQGECTGSVAAHHGLTVQGLWNDPANARQRRDRKDPGCVRPGDVLGIPTRRVKEISVHTGETVRVLVAAETCLTLRLDRREASSGDRFVLTSTDGAVRQERTMQDDIVPGDECVDLHFCGLPVDKEYTLRAEGADGQDAGTIFEGKTGGDFAMLSEAAPAPEDPPDTDGPRESDPFPDENVLAGPR